MYYMKKLIPVSIRRLIKSYFYCKDSFVLKNSHNVFFDIYINNFWQSNESKSGNGSLLDSTKVIRKELPKIIGQFNIKSILDIPCGDYHWMKTIYKSCYYIGGDIVSEIILNNQQLFKSDKVEFRTLDLTQDKLPKVDLIFCKDCLQHLSNENVKKAFKNIQRSVSKYLLVTSYPKTWRNHNIHDGDYRALNLFLKPFKF